MEVRPAREADRRFLAESCRRAFGSPTVASLGRLFHPARLPALVAWEAGHRVGALAFVEEAGGAEVVLLAADPKGRGTGSALLSALQAMGRSRGWERLRLCTTNDNTAALRFYQRRGWDLAALHRGAAARDREAKPGIPATGCDGIPLRHALELELRLDEDKEAPA
jgi:GNAT superfamily N-acetyltransferase